MRGYLLLTGTYMVRQLQPWFENVAKRQVKAPKIYFRDTGLLHALLGIPDATALLGHPRAGASWEGFAIEQILRALRCRDAWFWGAHAGGELDLMVVERGRRIGFEVKFNEAPRVTKAMRTAMETLALDHLFIVCPTREACRIDHGMTMLPDTEVVDLRARIAAL